MYNPRSFLRCRQAGLPPGAGHLRSADLQLDVRTGQRAVRVPAEGGRVGTRDPLAELPDHRADAAGPAADRARAQPRGHRGPAAGAVVHERRR